MTRKPNIPNLDCMPIEELRSFYEKYRTFYKLHKVTKKSRAETLLGLARPDGEDIVEILANFALNKLVAMQARLDGNVQTAIAFEKYAELAYKMLPKDCIW